MSAQAYFGTDGIRGIPGEPPLVPSVIRRVAWAAGRLLSQRHPTNGVRPFALIGRDTRGSGPLIGRHVADGLRAAGLDVHEAGIVPTPALSLLTRRWGGTLAVVLSASHNPPEFNGIKFFDGQGLKLSPETESEIERLAQGPGEPPRAKPRKAVDRRAEARRDYLDFLKSTLPPETDLTGLKVVADCANGAASSFAGPLLRSLGADVRLIGDHPSGGNINLGFGALETEAMRSEVKRWKAHAGVSFDGDADRAVFSDEKGALLDGDQLIAVLAEDWAGRGLLRGATVVTTVMSNRGLLEHLGSMGLAVEQVPVGDRQVSAALLSNGWSLGGEASGHIVLPRFAPTGDGLLTAVQVLAAFKRSGVPLSRLRRRFALYPQLLTSLPVKAKPPLEELPHLQLAVRKAEEALGARGRVLVRYSGTEPVLRIMAEGPRKAEIKTVVRSIMESFRRDAAGGSATSRS